MRILMLSPDAQMIDRRILQQARTLQEAGHVVTLLSGFECALPDAFIDHGIRVKRYTYDWTDARRNALAARIGPRLAKGAWLAVRVANRLLDGPTAFDVFVLSKILEHEFDVLHVHDLPLLKVGVAAADRVGAKVVYDSHEFYPMQSVLTQAQRDRYLKLERKLMRRCALTTTVNPYLAAMMGKTHMLPPPHVLLNAIEPTSAAVAAERDRVRKDPRLRARARARKRLPEGEFLFLYQGWISSERNLERLVEAMAHQPPGRRLVIVGYGEYLKNLRALADDLGVAERCLFYGRVESDELQDLTTLCDVGIIPYAAVDEMHRYCSPNKLYEFIMAGLPIIASDLPYLRDVVAGYGIGWLGVLDDPRKLSDLMDEAVASVGTLTGFDRARAELNWQVEGRKLVELYEAHVVPAAPPRRLSSITSAAGIVA